AEPIVDEVPASEPQISKQYIPPEAQPVHARAPRMPRIEDLPVPVQNAMRKKRAEAEETEIQQRRPRGLFRRLRDRLGGRRSEEREGDEEAAVQVRPTARQDFPNEKLPIQQPAPRPADSRSPDPISQYAKPPRQQPLDPHGRQT